MTALVNRTTGEIMDPYEVAGLKILDNYGEAPVSDEETRIDALATISAGKRGEGKDGHAGLPSISRDGTIVLHDPKGRAPALKAALEARGYKSLTIAFPFNNPAAFVQEHFTEYSSTHLLAHGDEYAITVIDTKNGTRTRLEAGTKAYDDARRRCKVSTSVYFALAEWHPEKGPQMRWDDGLDFYRIRFTSRNSLRILGAAISHVQSFTGGEIRGVPFDIAIDYRDVAGGDGSRRNVPVWTFVMAPPGGLTARTLGPLLRAALAEGQLLQIAPPKPEGEDVAEGDFREMGDDEDIADDDADLIARGGRCDAAYYRAHFFKTVDGTRYDTDDGRARLIREYTEDPSNGYILAYDSLAQFLAAISEREASKFLAHVTELRDRELASREAPTQPTGRQLMDTSEREPAPPSHAARTMARQAAALVADTPDDAADDAADLASNDAADVASNGASHNTSHDEQPEIQEHPATVADAVPPPPPTKPSASRAELEKLWGIAWNHANGLGLKSFVTISKLSDSELIDETAKLSARSREHERNSGEVDARDLDGAPAEGPSLPLGI